MKRKKSKLPSRVYKYALRPPTLNAELVDESHCESRRYYNKLVTIENRRRHFYRLCRAKYFPEYARAEEDVSALELRLEEERTSILSKKSEGRTRQVSDADRGSVDQILAELKLARKRVVELGLPIRIVEHELRVVKLETERAELAGAGDEDGAREVVEKLVKLVKKLAKLRERLAKILNETAVVERVREAVARMREDVEVHDEEALEAVKALRSSLYWGTYLLVEKAFEQASAKSKYDVAYDDTPSHLLKSRIGVHWVGGTSVEEVLSNDTLMQIVDPPEFRQTKSGPRYKRDEQGNIIYCMLRFRVGSVGKKKEPLWAELPLAYDRPLPVDGRIKFAYVTRRPLRERNPWQYYLCVSVEAASFERTLPHVTQEGTTTVNFGWRQLDSGNIRVATVNRDGGKVEYVEIPKYFVDGHVKCRKLQGLLDEKFEAVKKEIAGWISSRERHLPGMLPELFVESFEHVTMWKSQHKLCELVRYWEEHRVEGDDGIWSVVDEWRGRYLHLHDWMTNARRRLLGWRRDFYARVAKDLVITSAQVAIDTFKIADVAERPEAEAVEEGGERARWNRVVAAPSELRRAIEVAAKKYHCLVLAAPTVDGTRRCNVCGEIYEWDPAREFVHACPGKDGSGCSEWDQDVNNTDNLVDAVASGDVVPLVRPAEHRDGEDLISSEQLPYGIARKMLGK